MNGSTLAKLSILKSPSSGHLLSLTLNGRGAFPVKIEAQFGDSPRLRTYTKEHVASRLGEPFIMNSCSLLDWDALVMLTQSIL